MERFSRFRKVVATGGLVVTLAVLTAGPASAQPTDDRNDDFVVLTGRLDVAEGESVDTAVIFDGDATVSGTVNETLVVFNGDAEITGTVRKDVIAFNGTVTVRSGAEIGRNLVSRETPVVEDGATVRGEQQSIPDRIEIDEVGFASRFAWWLAFSVSTLILGLILLLVAPGLDLAVSRAARERLGAAIGFGALWFFALPILAVLLLITVVGIPLGVFLLLALALVYTIGYVAGAHGVGRLVMRTASSRFVVFLVGWGILRVIALVPVLGGLVWWLTALFGLGLLFVAARRGVGEGETAVVATAPGMPPRPA